MACKDMNRIINDKPVYVREWPATVALENLSAALKTFGVSFSNFTFGESTFQDVLSMMYAGDEKLVPLIQKFVCTARVDTTEVTPELFNHMYDGDLTFMFEVFQFVCEVQYKDFFMQGLPPEEKSQQK